MDKKDKKLIDLEDEEDFEISDYKQDGQTDEDFLFDEIVGNLQDIVISQQFEELQDKFFKKNFSIFEEGEENKMEYMTIFKEYQKTIESQIEKELKERIEDFQMKTFLLQIQKRPDQIDEQLLDMLYSFSDFETFKQIMLDYKKKYQEEERIEQLRTIKTKKKEIGTKVQKQDNIFSANNSNSNNLFASNDPLADLKNLKITGKSNKDNNKKAPQIDEIKDEDLFPSFFIECKQLKTPQIQQKKK